MKFDSYQLALFRHDVVVYVARDRTIELPIAIIHILRRDGRIALEFTKPMKMNFTREFVDAIHENADGMKPLDCTEKFEFGRSAGSP